MRSILTIINTARNKAASHIASNPEKTATYKPSTFSCVVPHARYPLFFAIWALEGLWGILGYHTWHNHLLHLLLLHRHCSLLLHRHWLSLSHHHWLLLDHHLLLWHWCDLIRCCLLHFLVFKFKC